jgi:CheY-like chemotaxis protein
LVLSSSLSIREAGVEAGFFSGFLMKPIRPSMLLDSLMTILASGEQKIEETTLTAPTLDAEMGSRHPLHILVAEDNVVNQKLALRLLSQMGYRADVAANGLEAIGALERQPYDVVLMDVQMPEMDGLEASRQICSRWPRDVRPRIIAMTANAMQGDREMCLEAGMDDYISKPVRVNELVSALLKAMPVKKGNSAHEKPRNPE